MSRHTAAPSRTSGRASAPARAYASLLRRLEELEALDAPARLAEPVATRLVSTPGLRRFFHGEATGIPLHPILTDVPFGAWFMTIYLDLYDDEVSRRAARRLIGLGIASAVPTALSGWAEWALAGEEYTFRWK